MIIIETTFSNKESAENMAKSLLQNKLCACVQISSINSFYQWDNEIENNDEFLLRIKTDNSLFEKLSQFITEHHEYEIPEIIATRISNIEEKYKNWLKTSLKS